MASLSPPSAHRIAILYNAIRFAETQLRDRRPDLTAEARAKEDAKWRAHALGAVRVLRNEFGISVIGYEDELVPG